MDLLFISQRAVNYAVLYENDSSFSLFGLNSGGYMRNPCEFFNPIQLANDFSALRRYQRKHMSDTTVVYYDFIVRRIDTLVYKFGDFVEYQRTPASYPIASVQLKDYAHTFTLYEDGMAVLDKDQVSFYYYYYPGDTIRFNKIGKFKKNIRQLGFLAPSLKE